MVTKILVAMVVMARPEINIISILESSSGKFVNHKPDSRGAEWTAIGSCGIKPVTAIFTINNNPTLKAKYGGLTVDAVAARMQNDYAFYIEVADAHWDYLRARFKAEARAVYAWRWGIGKAKSATWQEVAFDSYVLKFHELRLTAAK